MTDGGVTSMASADGLLRLATKSFELRFDRVVEFDPEQKHPSRSPSGKPYVVYAAGIERTVGEPLPTQSVSFSDTESAEMFARRMMDASLDGATTLYWRVRPEFCRDHGTVYVYCRCAWD